MNLNHLIFTLLAQQVLANSVVWMVSKYHFATVSWQMAIARLFMGKKPPGYCLHHSDTYSPKWDWDLTVPGAVQVHEIPVLQTTANNGDVQNVKWRSRVIKQGKRNRQDLVPCAGWISILEPVLKWWYANANSFWWDACVYYKKWL